MSNQTDDHIAIIGLGYVGLPLAVEFAKHFPVTGFDVDTQRIKELASGDDRTDEIDRKTLKQAKNLRLTSDEKKLKQANTYIVAVPTPVTIAKTPNLTPLKNACKTVARTLGKNDLVIFESTVYPGATEEICIPILEELTGLTLNKDFYVGYSPERINPGDKTRPLPSIIKITSGSNSKAAKRVDCLYQTIISAGTHLAPSIKVAEAAKITENIQRDVNIALMNELAMVFHKVGINTSDVLEAAGTKWNFLPFKPGLVGGHCISVDPYYLTHKADILGFHPDIIMASRRLNDGMGKYVAQRVLDLMIKKGINPNGAALLVMGATFKENCPDLRNTKVLDIVRFLQSYQVKIEIWEPVADKSHLTDIANCKVHTRKPRKAYDAIIMAVSHDQFRQLNDAELDSLKNKPNVVYDVKSMLDSKDIDGQL